MKIIDTNVLNAFLSDVTVIDLDEIYYITNDLQDELDMLRIVAGANANKLERINFKMISLHDFFEEERYYRYYKDFLYTDKNIVSFYNMKGIGDISILAAVKTILNTSQFNFSQDVVEVYCNDKKLKDSLVKNFSNNIVVIDPILKLSISI